MGSRNTFQDNAEETNSCTIYCIIRKEYINISYFFKLMNFVRSGFSSNFRIDLDLISQVLTKIVKFSKINIANNYSHKGNIQPF